MKTSIKLPVFLVASLMLLVAISPAMALASPATAPTSSTSPNWSGYAVTGPTGSVTSAYGSWKVPFTTSPEPWSSTTYFAASWVGMDGFKTGSTTVEQIGTMAESTGRSTMYIAWFEFYPGPAYELVTSTGAPAPVNPGDTIFASVTYGPVSASTIGGPSNALSSPINALVIPSNIFISPSDTLTSPSNALTSPSWEFTVTIYEKTQGWSFSTSESVPGAQRSSAEWIVERPATISDDVITLLPLADFHTVNYGYDATGIWGTCYATISGIPRPLGSFDSAIQSITMVTSVATATPSPISYDKTSFSDTWSREYP
jgi:hypothetical protein